MMPCSRLRAAYRMRVCAVPPKDDGSKRPIGKQFTDATGEERWGWEPWQHERSTADELRAWYVEGSHSGIGFVCGAVSENLELFEFDDRPTYDAFKQAAESAGLGELVERIEAGYLEETPGGGIHWFWRCGEIGGNEALARRPKRPEEMEHEHDKVLKLIETRGEGGYAVVAPSNGRVHPSGRPIACCAAG